MLPSYVNSTLKIKDCFTCCEFFFFCDDVMRVHSSVKVNSPSSDIWKCMKTKMPAAVHLKQKLRYLKMISSDQLSATKINRLPAKRLYTKSKDSKQVLNEDITFRDAWMSKKGLFRTLKGSLVLSICPVFIFSIRGEMISFSMHSNRMLKSHWPTG